MSYCLLFLILLFSVISRYFLINTVPPIFYPSVANLRMISALLNILIIPLIYFYAKRVFKKDKVALLSTWVMATLPWVIEQGRIFSQPGNVTFLLLLYLILIRLIPSKLYKIGITLIFITIFHLIYTQFWMFRVTSIINPQINYLSNLFTLISPEMLFFRNSTYWWVGVKEVGIVWILFMPFFIIGIYETFFKHKYHIIVPLLIILLISIMSPFFPESREFYLATPFISIIIGSGINTLTSKKYPLVLISAFIIFFIYEMGQFMHYYYIHYPQDMNSNRPNISQPF